MDNENATLQTTPIVNQAPVAAPVTPAEPDLITKVTQFKRSQPQAPASDNSVDIGFDYKEIEAIRDPVAKDIAMRAYKSMQSGVTKKFQEAALTRKEAETQLAEMQNWTPEKVQKYLLNNPTFLQSAQQVAGQSASQNPPNSGLTDDQFSALTDNEKAMISSLKNEVQGLKQVNFQALVLQADNQLKSKFSNFETQLVDNGMQKLGSMNPIEIREYVYKALKHDENVQNAYELGLQEAKQLNQTRLNGVSTDGMQTVNNDGLPVRQANQNDMSWFQTLANFRLSQSRKK